MKSRARHPKGNAYSIKRRKKEKAYEIERKRKDNERKEGK